MKLPNGLALSLALLLLPGLAGAQMPPGPPHPPGAHLGKWWKNSEIVRELGLSDAQINQIEQTFLDQRLKLIDLHAELEKHEVQLQTLMEADQPDETQVNAQLDQVLTARGRLEKAHAMMMLAIRRVLSVEQWKKLQAMHHDRVYHLHPGMMPLPLAPFVPEGPPVAMPPESL